MRLTKKQTRFLSLLQDFIAERGEAPTMEEMKVWMEARDWGEVRSLNSVKQYFDALEDRGAIRRESRKRGIELVKSYDPTTPTPTITNELLRIPILASPVSCGAPTTLLEEEAVDHLQISPSLANGKDLYAFQTSGDSMNLAGIDDGDFVLIEPTADIRDGEQVLATIDGCGTIKKLRRESDHLALLPQSSNDTHQPIYLDGGDDFAIAGRVHRVFKNN